MTKVGQLYYEEKLDAVYDAVRKRDMEYARQMLIDNKDLAEIMKYTGLSRADIEAVRETQ
jgi:anthranilate/para-aminobenzoate synthase component I